jgi:hypothetical protein
MRLPWFEVRKIDPLCIVATMLAITPMAVAHADANDDQFVAALNAAGVPGDRGAEIGIAHQWCDAQNLPRAALGVPAPWGVAMQRISGEASAQGIMPGPQTISFKTAARDAYCPGASLS